MTNWYSEEAHPLGVLFGINERDDTKIITVVEDLNLNFGVNKKRVKRQKSGRCVLMKIGELKALMEVNSCHGT